jgi:hypothetical protein
MANTRGPLNSADPSTSFIVGGVFNASPPAPADQQPCALQLDSQGNLLVNVAVGGGGTASSVKIQDSSGNVLNSDGSGALKVAVISGGGSNPSVGLTGAAAPTSATEIGIIDGTGKLQGVSSSNPLRIDPTGTTTQPVSGTVSVTQGTSPWVVSLSSTTITGTVSVTQGTSPWVVSNGGTFVVQEATLDAALISQEATTAGVKGLTAFGAVTTNAPSYTTAKSDALSLDTSGLLRISLKDTPANTNKFLVTADPITFASPQHVIVDSGSIGVTQSTSPWVVSNGGTFAVQEATLDAALISQEATTAGVKGLTAFGAVTTNAPSYTTAKSDALSLDTSGLLRISLKDTPANTNKFLVTADPITFASAQHVIVDSGSIGVTQSTSPWVVSLTSTTITGTVSVTQGTSPWVVAGNLTNNNAAPGAANLGVLSSLANAATPLWTEGDLVLSSVDLGGNLRVNVNEWGGILLGAPANFGVSPGSVASGNVNASLFQGAVAVSANAPLQVNISNTGVSASTVMIDLLQTLITETRAMRSVLVYMVTETGSVRDSDFDPDSLGLQTLN